MDDSDVAVKWAVPPLWAMMLGSELICACVFVCVCTVVSDKRVYKYVCVCVKSPFSCVHGYLIGSLSAGAGSSAPAASFCCVR
jgi:hypothetical protein